MFDMRRLPKHRYKHKILDVSVLANEDYNMKQVRASREGVDMVEAASVLLGARSIHVVDYSVMRCNRLIRNGAVVVR